MLERSILAALVKITRPDNIFEFGTFLGETTALLASNSEASVVTIDLDGTDSLSPLLDSHEQKNLAHKLCRNKIFHTLPEASRIQEILGDSTRIDLTDFYATMDFILIDGGHHIDVVRRDTENAFKMIRPGNKACIVWHDYGNPCYKITDFLDSLATTVTLFHIEGTQYVYYCSEDSKLHLGDRHHHPHTKHATR
ncbi:class I SAM-dependent methyltransferase [Desulfolithobacter sp.]